MRPLPGTVSCYGLSFRSDAGATRRGAQVGALASRGVQGNGTIARSDPSSDSDAVRRRRAEIGDGPLRHRVARGTLVNSVYLVFINAMTIIQGLLAARLLGAPEYGLWGLLLIIFGTLAYLAGVGVNDKYVQQDQSDQEAAFQVGFTLQALLSTFFALIALVAVPLSALLYDKPEIVLPGLLTALTMPLMAFEAPAWVFYRRMDFARTRLLASVRPVVMFLVTIPLAAAGVGFWALVIGSIAGVVAGAVAAVVASPYKLRLRYERGAVREYTSYSWPVLVSSLMAVVAFQVPVTIASRTIGAAAIGAIALTYQIIGYTSRIDDVVTHALYPAICAVKDRRDLLFESFSKSNRLAVLWGFPVGVGAALFAGELVVLVLGEEWKLAVPLIQVLGLTAAIDQIGFNWTAFAKARGETRILAVQSGLVFVAVLGVGVPLLLLDGLPGYAAGIAAGALVSLGVRFVYLTRLFPALDLVNHVLGAIAPAVLAAGTVLLARATLPSGGGLPRTCAELLAYVAIALAASWATERVLLKEAFGYLRRAARPATAAPS
jgi:O-antigen/teichoic acid export membrane protein